VSQPSTRLRVIWRWRAGAGKHSSGFGTGRQALVLDPAPESLVRPLDGVRRPDRFLRVRRKEQEGTEVGASLKAGSDSRALQPPFGSLRPNVRTTAFRLASIAPTQNLQPQTAPSNAGAKPLISLRAHWPSALQNRCKFIYIIRRKWACSF
jgi:hypothetical protein